MPFSRVPFASVPTTPVPFTRVPSAVHHYRSVPVTTPFKRRFQVARVVDTFDTEPRCHNVEAALGTWHDVVENRSRAYLCQAAACPDGRDGTEFGAACYWVPGFDQDSSVKTRSRNSESAFHRWCAVRATLESMHL